MGFPSAGRLRFSAVLLEFYVTCDGSCQERPLVVCDFDGKNKQAAPTPHNPSRRREAAAIRWPQVMNGQIGSSNAFIKAQLAENGESSGRIDERSDCAPVNHTLVLKEFGPNLQVDGDFPLVNLAKLETEQLRVWDRREGFARPRHASRVEFIFTHER